MPSDIGNVLSSPFVTTKDFSRERARGRWLAKVKWLVSGINNIYWVIKKRGHCLASLTCDNGLWWCRIYPDVTSRNLLVTYDVTHSATRLMVVALLWPEFHYMWATNNLFHGHLKRWDTCRSRRVVTSDHLTAPKSPIILSALVLIFYVHWLPKYIL